MKNPIIKHALEQALATALYVVVIASSLFYAPTFFGEAEKKTVLIPIIMLLLLVFSAGLTGSLVFGRSILWYLDGKKKEAVSLLLYTFGFLLGIILLGLLGLFFIQRS